MSYSSRTKDELCRLEPDSVCCLLAELSGIISVAGSVILRGGGDTKMLMLTDNIFLWVASIPLGIIAGPILHLPPFWIYFCLKIDQVLKAIWCVWRLKSGKWIKKIRTEKELAEA